MRVLRLPSEVRKELYQEYLKSGHWQRKRAEILARAGSRCEICGASGKLEIHHLTYKRLFQEADRDLIALCPDCHARQHGLQDGYDMLDFNTKRTGPLILAAIDSAILANAAREKRDYLGASSLGDECQRKLQFAYFGAPKDEPPDARTLRIFTRGNLGEELMAKWLASAGFSLVGRQAEFSQLKGRLKGHVDGIIDAGPADCGPYPRLWENKVLGTKSWKKLEREGLKRGNSVYYGQMQLYMAYLELDANPGLFTALNGDTMEILCLDVGFDQECAQNLSDKAVRIIRACEAGELLPRCAKDETWHLCKLCAWSKRCWTMGQ